jgi:peptidoglycan/xylan/chitin deacetylase (PgdA/CDA1 family)
MASVRQLRRRALGLAARLALGGLALGAASPDTPPAPADWSRPETFVARWGVGQVEPAGEGASRWPAATTRGDGTIALFAPAQPLAQPLDLRGRQLRVRVRVDDVAALEGLELRLSSDGFARSFLGFAVPLFADPSFNLLQPGEWTALSWSLAAARAFGEPDSAAIDAAGWAVTDRPDPRTGARRPVRLEWRDLSWLPAPARGVVSFTFDDGYDEHFGVAAPALAAHGFRGTAYVIADQVGAPGYLSLEQLRALHDRFGWTVAAHHLVPLPELGARLEAELDGVDRFLRANGFADGARHLAYPLGQLESSRVLPAVRSRYATARLASGGAETLPPADPHRLRAWNVTRATTPEQVVAAAQRAAGSGEWLILMFHFLVERPERDTEYALRDFARVVEGVARSGAEVQTIEEVWRRLGPSYAPAPPFDGDVDAASR